MARSTFKTDVRIFNVLQRHYFAFSMVELLKRKHEKDLAALRNQAGSEKKRGERRRSLEQEFREELEKYEGQIQKLNLPPLGLSFSRIVTETHLGRATVAGCLKRFSNHVSATRIKHMKLYRIVNRPGLIYQILGEIGDFRKVKSLFRRSVTPPAVWSLAAFWATVAGAEMDRAIRHIDNLSLSEKHLRFIKLYEDYLVSCVPEEWLENASFEDWFLHEYGKNVHPPMTDLKLYTMRKYGQVLKEIYGEGKLVALEKI